MEHVALIWKVFWDLLAEMGPYLWLGFVLTFFLKLLVRPEWIRQRLGGEGWRPVLTATLAGVPLPLCSCGVLPVAAAIRREGGSKGSVAAFAVSTPQTGVDSVLATAALLGWPMAFLRLGTAFLSGLLAGLLAGLVGRKNCSAQASSKPSCCGSAAAEANPGQSSQRATKTGALRFAFLQLPADIGLPLLAGSLVAALAVVWIPPGALASLPGGTLGSYVAVSLFALPVYVCSAGVIPLAFGLIAAGLPAGAAFILLAAGPSVSAASIATLGKLIGPLPAATACLAMLAVAWGIAGLLDFSALAAVVPECELHETAASLWRQLLAGALVALIAVAKLRNLLASNAGTQ